MDFSFLEVVSCQPRRELATHMTDNDYDLFRRVYEIDFALDSAKLAEFTSHGQASPMISIDIVLPTLRTAGSRV